MKSAGNNSFYCIFARQKRKSVSENAASEQGHLAAAGAAAKCYASERCSIPRCSAKPGAARALAGRAQEVRFHSGLRQALRGRDSASAGGYRAVPVRCSIPWCTRSDSGAGGGRPADAAQEALFPVPASRASFNSAGASERSACQPRQRVAKCEAASIGCSIPLPVILVGRGNPRGVGV